MKKITTFNIDLEKGGKKAAIGETRVWSGKKYTKTNSGWEYQSDHSPQAPKQAPNQAAPAKQTPAKQTPAPATNTSAQPTESQKTPQSKLPAPTHQEPTNKRDLVEEDKKEYVNARKSSIANKGEDIKGAARHKRKHNNIKDYSENEFSDIKLKDLLNQFPVDLSKDVSEQNPINPYICNQILQRFPKQPKNENQKKFYLEVFEWVRNRVQDFSKRDELDFAGILKTMQAEIVSMMKENRASEGYVRGSDDVFVPYVNRTLSLRSTKGSVAQDATDLIEAFKKDILDSTSVSDRKQRAYAAMTTKEGQESIKKLIEGKDIYEAFNKEKESSDIKKFSVADYYTKTAKRTGPDTKLETVEKQENFLLKSCNVRGLQWGNSVSDSERKHHLKMTSEALKDLADITGLPETMISFNGKLGLAIGARGKGTALAHYEPDEITINLTREKGVGSLSHEWGHFLDNILAKTHNVNAHADNIYLSEAARFNMGDKSPVKEAMSELVNSEAWQHFKKTTKEALDDLVSNGFKMKSSYWLSPRELFARAFEGYIGHKLSENKRENTYLTGGNKGLMWTTDEQNAKLAPYFDKFLEELKKSEHIEKAEDILNTKVINGSPFRFQKSEFKDKLKGGLADKKKPSDFNKDSLEEGIKVELEHTKDKSLALEIAMDHLTEDKEYYKKLKTIEKSELDLFKAPIIDESNAYVEPFRGDKKDLTQKYKYQKSIKTKKGNIVHHYINDFNKDKIRSIFATTDNNHPSGMTTSYLEVKHRGESDEPQISMAWTHDDHRKKGLNYDLHRIATKHFGSVESDQTLSPTAGALWERKALDPDMHTELAPTEHGDPMDNNIQNEEAFIPHKSTWKDQKLAASDSTEIDLNKGSLQARHRFNPKNIGAEEKEDVQQWQEETNEIGKQRIPRLEGNARLRALNKLHSKTKTRRHPETGERMFLLHRGTSHEQANLIERNKPMPDEENYALSWTPHVKIANRFGSSHEDVSSDENGRTVSAWIPESSIHYITPQIGAVSGEQGPNEMRKEHEVIVNPHIYMLHEENPTKNNAINNRINTRGKIDKDFNQYKEAGKKMSFGGVFNKDSENQLHDMRNKKLADFNKKNKLAASEKIDINKTLTAGSPMGAPSTLTGGEALQRESLGKKFRRKKKEVDINKGERGDWKKEGYKIKMTHENSPVHQGPRVSAIKDNKEVGFARINGNKKHITANDTHVNEEHRRKGLASAMYSHAEKKLKRKIKPAKLQTEEGKKLWDSQNRKFGKSEKLDHYSPIQGLKQIDPNQARSGVDQSSRSNQLKNKISFYYPEGYEHPEHVVTSGAKSKYKAQLDPNHKIFDSKVHGSDLINHVKQANNGVLNMDMLIDKLKEQGFHGLKTRPQGIEMVAMFHPLNVAHEEKLGHNDNMKKSEQKPFQQPHILMSFENPFHETNKKMSHEEGLKHLKDMGMDAESIKGKYGNEENSVMIKNPNPEHIEHIKNLARDLGQDSVISSSGEKHNMHFLHGEKAGKRFQGTGTVVHNSNPDDFYSTLNDGTKFTHNFDMDTLHPDIPAYRYSKERVGKFRFNNSIKKSDGSGFKKLLPNKQAAPDITSKELSETHKGHGAPLFHHIIKNPNNEVHHVISYDKEFNPKNPNVARISGHVDNNNNLTVNRFHVNDKLPNNREATRALLGASFHHNNIHIPHSISDFGAMENLKTVHGYQNSSNEKHKMTGLEQESKNHYFPKYYRTFREQLAKNEFRFESLELDKSLKHFVTLLGLVSLGTAIHHENRKAPEEPKQVQYEAPPEYNVMDLDRKVRSTENNPSPKPEYVYEYIQKHPESVEKKYNSLDHFKNDYTKRPEYWKSKYFDFAYKEHKGNHPKITRSFFDGIYHDN